MAINKIISEKTLSYIETLYLYANLQDFIIVDDEYVTRQRNNYLLDDVIDEVILNKHALERYRDHLDYIYDTMLYSAEFIGSSNGRMWYKFDNYRLGIMDYDDAKKSNQFNVEIQYTQFHLFNLKAGLKGLDLPFDGSFDQYKIKRIDVTQIVKTPVDYLTNYKFISPYRTIAEFMNKGITETVYLGNRKSGNVFRMYNKTIELKVDTKDKPIDYKKIELFSKYFGDIESLYTFELELHRKYLKPTFGIDTLGDLEKVYKAHKDIVGKIKIYEDNDHNRKLISQKHHDRVESLHFIEYEELERVEKKKYKTSKKYMIDKAITAYSRYEQSFKDPIDQATKLSIVSEIVSGIVGDKDIVISIEENNFSRSFREMSEKHESMRINQDDQLNKEAIKAFSPLFLHKATQVF